MKQVEKQMAYVQKTVSDYSKEELRNLIAKEEKDIIKSYKIKSTFGALMTMLGISYF